MTKTELLAKISEKEPSLGRKQADGALKALAEIVGDALAKGEEIHVPGIGKFKVATRPPRMQRNPQTGEMKQVGEKKVVKFSLAKSLKDSVS